MLSRNAYAMPVGWCWNTDDFGTALTATSYTGIIRRIEDDDSLGTGNSGTREFCLRFNASGSTLAPSVALEPNAAGDINSVKVAATSDLPWQTFRGVVPDTVFTSDGVAAPSGVPNGYWFWAQTKGRALLIADEAIGTAGAQLQVGIASASGRFKDTTVTTVAIDNACVAQAVATAAGAASTFYGVIDRCGCS